MYKKFYGLKEKPFNLTPDPAYFYFSGTHKSAYSYLKYAIAENKGFVVITGDIGSGKTTLIKYMLRHIDRSVNVGLIANTNVRPESLLRVICREFELNVDRIGISDLHEVFYGFLLKEYAHNKRVVLIIDEAQNLTRNSLEEIRMLSNLESDKNHLLQVILVGQPGLKDMFNRRAMEQFTQRISVTYHLRCLTMNETRRYINFRLQKAGAGNGSIFKPKAIDEIYRYSGGIPRVINILCDTALLYGYSEGVKELDDKMIKEVIADRKKSGIYGILKDEQGEKRPEGVQEEKTVRTGLESMISVLDDRMEDLENRLAKIDQSLEIIARRDEIALELMKVLKESIKRRIIMYRIYREVDALNENKIMKWWRSWFRKKS